MPTKNMLTDIADKVRSALGDLKIQDATDKQLSEKFVLIYWMVGLRPQHFPTAEQDQFLFNYLRSNFGSRTTTELVLAFDRAINGVLDVDDVKCYDQFTLEYFCRIFNAYRKWVFNLSKEIQKPEEYKSLPMAETTEQEMREDIEYYLKGDLNIKLIPPYLYDYLERLNIHKLSKEEKIAVFDKAKIYRKFELKEFAQSYDKGDIANYNYFCHKLETGFEKDSQEMFHLKNLAKKMAFIYYAKNINAAKTKSSSTNNI
jgi:hypothetical protein